MPPPPPRPRPRLRPRTRCRSSARKAKPATRPKARNGPLPLLRGLFGKLLGHRPVQVPGQTGEAAGDWDFEPVQIWVGLGNPGAQYALHRHNVGFMAVDAIAETHGFRSEEHSLNSSHSQISYAVFCLKKKRKYAKH